MSLDIRYPIGLMFALFGVMLVIFGLVSDPAIYQRSFGINVNLWWGIVLFAFGTIMLGLAYKAKPKQR